MVMRPGMLTFSHVALRIFASPLAAPVYGIDWIKRHGALIQGTPIQQIGRCVHFPKEELLLVIKWLQYNCVGMGSFTCIKGWQLAKNEKEYSWHVPAIKFIGMKQLVSKVANILEKLRNLWKWEIWGNIVKILYFVNYFLTEAQIQKFFCTCVTHIIVIIWNTAHYVST